MPSTVAEARSETRAGGREARSEAVHAVALALRDGGLISKWRGETLALTSGFNAPPALLVLAPPVLLAPLVLPTLALLAPRAPFMRGRG